MIMLCTIVLFFFMGMEWCEAPIIIEPVSVEIVAPVPVLSPVPTVTPLPTATPAPKVVAPVTVRRSSSLPEITDYWSQASGHRWGWDCAGIDSRFQLESDIEQMRLLLLHDFRTLQESLQYNYGLFNGQVTNGCLLGNAYDMDIPWPYRTSAWDTDLTRYTIPSLIFSFHFKEKGNYSIMEFLVNGWDAMEPDLSGLRWGYFFDEPNCIINFRDVGEGQCQLNMIKLRNKGYLNNGLNEFLIVIEQRGLDNVFEFNLDIRW